MGLGPARLLAFRVMRLATGSKVLGSLVLLASTAVLGPAAVIGTNATAATRTRPLLPPHEPAKNFRLASVHAVLASIDTARRSEEGLAPLNFDVT